MGQFQGHCSRRFWRIAVGLTVLAAGCGQGEYERRLKRRSTELQSAPPAQAAQPNIPDVPPQDPNIPATDGLPAEQTPTDGGAPAGP